MQEFIKVMKALSDPNRVKIIKMLEQKEAMCVCEMRAVLELAQPTVSKHLKVLEEAGLIVGSKEKLWVNYRLNRSAASPYVGTMLRQLGQWLNDDPAIAEIGRILPSIDRHQLCQL